MSATLNGLPAFPGSLDLGVNGAQPLPIATNAPSAFIGRKRPGGKTTYNTNVPGTHSHLSLEDLDRHGVQAVEEGFVDLARMSEREGGGVGEVTWQLLVSKHQVGTTVEG